MRAGHTSNCVEPLAPDPEGFRIKEFVPHMNTRHEANDQAIIANLQSPPLAALQARGCLRNAWRPD